MKKTKLILILTVVFLLAGLSSCDLFVNFFGTTIDERIDAFNDDAKDGNLSKLYTHFHSDTKERDDMKNDPDTYWYNSPMASENYIDSYSVSGDDVDGKMTSDQDVNVKMKRDGLDYMMFEMTIDGSPDFTVRKYK